MTHDSLIASLIDICREHKTAEKWLVLPSLALGHTISDRLALSGHAWVNLRPGTPAQIAQDIAAPILASRHIMPLNDVVGPALIVRLLAETPLTGRDYFRGLVESPGLSEALWSGMTELRLAGLTSEGLPDEIFVSPLKARELRHLLAAYEQYLHDGKLADSALMLQVAIDQMPTHRAGRPRLLLVPTDVAWRPLEQALISALPGIPVNLRHSVPGGLPVPRRLIEASAGASGPSSSPVTALTDSQRLPWLFSPEQAPPPANDRTLEWFHAAGHEAEVHEVFRRALASGAPWDAIEIACTTDEPYVTLIWEICARLDVPVTLASGVPVTMTRPGRALLGFCRWIEQDFSGGGLCRLLQSGDIHLDLPDGPRPGQAARLLARCDIAWGRGTYARSLQGLIQTLRREATHAAAEGETEDLPWREERVAHAVALASWVDTVLERVPPVDPDHLVDEAALIRACVQWVDRYAAVTGPLDGAARQALIETLTALGDLPPIRQRLTVALGQVIAAVERTRVDALRPQPGSLHVTRLADAGWAGRPRTFVVGLEQGAFPAPSMPDPILLDEERTRLHAALATTGDRITESLYTGASRLAALGGQVTLSYPNRDLRDDRLLFPSSVILQAYRLTRMDRSLTYEDLAAELGEPATRLPATQAKALDDSGWWLRGARQARTAARPAAQAAFSLLSSGEAAEEARDGNSFTAWDGLVPSAAGDLDPRRNDRPISATAIEQLAKCPFQYFLTRGLRLKPSTRIERDPGAWLDPLTRGSLLHELFAAFLRDCRDRGVMPNLARDRARIHQIGERDIAALREQLPPPNEAVFQHEREALLTDLDRFLAFTAGLQDREVVGIEVAFGRGVTEDQDPLAQEEPIVLDLGQDLRFSLHGRIDRIDRISAHRYEVVDYKTGRPWARDRRIAHLAHGGQVQHALYALAAETLLRKSDRSARVVDAAYWFPTERGECDVVSRKPEEWQRLPGLLRDLLSLLRDGVFPHTTTARECDWCDVASACGPKPWDRKTMKHNDPRLDAVRAIKGDEYA